MIRALSGRMAGAWGMLNDSVATACHRHKIQVILYTVSVSRLAARNDPREIAPYFFQFRALVCVFFRLLCDILR